MRLRRLDIKGFKSFARPTTIHFHEKVIGIVGPNGSGKSNIVDAIRWVLGEQSSKELRLEKMSNVIFNGTKKHKASGSAQVSLTFENTQNLIPTDFQTVTVSRILYRTGESEYKLNNVTCRLKDITSLFLDTGVGSDSYAIIALGMVDEILADKDDARRKMFEQAAGISKYKNRKKQTLQKLKTTEADLDRVEDLLFEIETNLKSLEKQARRTRKYLQIKQQYKDLSCQLSLLRLSSMGEKKERLEKQKIENQKTLQDNNAQIRTLEALIEKDKKANIDSERSLSSRQKELQAALEKINQVEADKRLAQEKIKMAEVEINRLNKQLDSGKDRIGLLMQEITALRSQLKTEQEQGASIQAQLSLKKEQLDQVNEEHTNLKQELQVVLSDQKNFDQKKFDLEKQLAILDNKLETLQEETKKIDIQTKDKATEIETLEKKLQGIVQQKEKVHHDLDERTKAEEHRKSQLRTLEIELEEARKKVSQINRKLDARKNEFKLTKSMVENLEGFPESIKFLSKSNLWNKEVPLLSDLIYCQEEYRVAIENYLEPYLNNYVVQSMEDAIAAISLLSNSQKGKANFFILDAFTNYEPPILLLPDANRAMDRVQTDPPYRKLVQFLLVGVVLTDSEKLPEKLRDEDVTVISRNGRFIQKRFSISGGSIGLFEGKKIGRKKNLEVLEAAIEQIEKEERHLTSQYFTIQSKLEKLQHQQYQDAIETLKRQLNMLDQEKVSIMTRLEAAENFSRDAKEKEQYLYNRIKDLQKEKSDIGNLQAAIIQNAEEAKGKVDYTDTNFKSIAESLTKVSTAYNELNVAFLRQENLINMVQGNISFKEQQWKEIQENKRTNEEKEQELKEDISSNHLLIGELDKTLQHLYAERDRLQEVLSEAEQLYFEARGKVVEIEDQLRTLMRNQQLQKDIQQQVREKLAELQVHANQVMERINIEFGISKEQLLQLSLEEGQEEIVLAEKVDRLQKRMHQFGEVNPLAVEAYQEMEDRHRKIMQQRDDIKEAKSSLLQTIKEIEDTATTHFLVAFSTVRENFQEVFRNLFSAQDTCDLVLSDPENPLESKIEITARPKGKRPQTINQLSGGEKTLTATALLFALYLLKPAPFCIFDEVDAPLDDANIEKFNRIVQRFSSESQFIIVTHNKQTMAAVDVIYGVYMQEQGVSSVSPVDFRSLQHSSVFETA